MCNCSSSCVPVGPRGLTGATGLTGPQGLPGASGMIYETFIDPAIAFALNTGDQLITGGTYTFTEAGNYQIHISLQIDLAVGTPATSAINWFLDTIKVQQKILCDANTAPTTLVENKCINFVWRGAVTAGQVFQLRGQLGAGVTSGVVQEMSILINKEL